MTKETTTMRHTAGCGFSSPASGRFLLAPEASEVAGGGGAPDPAQGTLADSSGLGSDGGLGMAGSSGVADLASTASGLGDGGSGVADLGRETVEPAQAQQAAEQWQSIREAAGALGYDLSQYQDDRAALAHLVQSAARSREANYYAQLGQQLAPHAGGIQEYLAQQRKPAAAPERPSYAPPEFDKRWLALVEFDPNAGVYLAKPGAPAEVAAKVNAFSEWQEKFRSNPLEMIQPAIEDRLSKAVEERVSAAMAERQRAADIERIVAQNADWLYQKDASGRPVADASGRYVPTPYGARYAQHVSSLQRAGVSDPVAADQMARTMLSGEIAMAQVREAQQQGQAAAGAAPALAVARAQANPLQAAARANPGAFVPGATEQTDSGLSLSDMLRRDMRAAGISDADFAQIDAETA